MSQKITAKKIKNIRRQINEALKPSNTVFDPMEHPYIVTSSYFPGDMPVDHWLTPNHDVRSYSDAARNGWWEIVILDADNPHIPAAMAAFSEYCGQVIAERLSVGRPYRGIGLGELMIQLGSRLWGEPVDGADKFTDQNEVFWNSPLADELA
ncbi:hypothetical protein [Roseibium sp. MMSF_3412]|uniref:hypothetical protein n=1 Tax=Roseibium sp. MMSF_3412 TaxID=3046712 RepID=UPI00273FE687|nr:hypothetical protein [Roseibium sp. MMSF_3412]